MNPVESLRRRLAVDSGLLVDREVKAKSFSRQALCMYCGALVMVRREVVVEVRKVVWQCKKCGGSACWWEVDGETGEGVRGYLREKVVMVPPGCLYVVGEL